MLSPVACRARLEELGDGLLAEFWLIWSSSSKKGEAEGEPSSSPPAGSDAGVPGGAGARGSWGCQSRWKAASQRAHCCVQASLSLPGASLYL